MMTDKIKILLAESDNADASMVCRKLSQVKSCTYEVDWAKSYDEALATIGRREHDAILLDHRLGAEKTLGLFQEALRNNHHPPLIVITDIEDHEADLRMMEAGATDFLLKKELSPTLLERTIRYSIGRRQIERPIRVSEALYRGTFQDAPMGITHTSLEGRYLLVNPRFCEFMGYSSEELLLSKFQDLMPSEGVQPDLDTRERLITSEIKMDRQEKKYRKKDGSMVWANRLVSLVRNASNAPSHFVCIYDDITERKQAEEQLQQAQGFYQHTLDALAAHIAILDETGKIIAVNEAWHRFAHDNDYPDETHGIGADYLKVCLNATMTGTDLAAEVLQGILEVLDGASDFYQWEYPCHSPTEQRWFLLKVTRFSEDPLRVVISHENTTMIKQASIEIAFQARLLNDINEAVIATDLQGKILYWNRFSTRLYGWEREEILGKDSPGLPPSLMRIAGQEDIYQLLIQGKSWAGETLVKTREGKEIPIYAIDSPLHDETGELIGVLGISSDISERKRNEQALRESEELFRSLVEQSPLAIQILSSTGFILQVNQAWKDLFDAPEPLPTYNIMEDEQLIEAGIMEDIGRCFSGATVTFPPMAYDPKNQLNLQDEYNISRKWTQSFMYPVKDEAGVVQKLVLIHQDITKRKRLEEQLRQSQKMEAIGRLAGGIAHDFNNMLSVINGYSELLLSRMDANHPLARPLSQIQSAGEKAAALTRQLLAFSRKQILEPRILSLNQVVSGMESILRRLIGEDVELEIVFSEPPAHVRADPTQIEQVIMNLVINARDAMSNRGRIEIRTGEVHLTREDQMANSFLQTGRYSILTIRDTGIGMAADVQKHIFEPFFTTKEVGKGTGLGLSTVYGIVKQSDGYILTESAPGKGTTFKIYLPWVEECVAEETTKARPASRGSGTILVAEDDLLVQDVVKDMLEAEGYDVLTASDGEETLQICAAKPGEIDLLMADTVMPRMSGIELVEAMKAAHPGIPILLMSGYSDDMIRLRGELPSETAFIHKPFSPRSLFLKINECFKGVSSKGGPRSLLE